MKDYNNELESILDCKDFSVDAKNILLSMFYKIDIAYNDYATVKANVEDKKSYLENLLNTIESLNKITLIKPKEADKIDSKNIYNKFTVDKLNKTLEVYPNEITMLYALNDFNTTKMFLDDDYNLIRNSFPALINKGREINDTEIIRDFDAWSWNTQIKEIPSIEVNLLYQNILLLFGYKKLEEILISKSVRYDLQIFENKLKALYGDDIATQFLDLLYKISIILATNENEEERKRLFSEKKWIEREFNRLNNKNKFIEDTTQSKKVIMKKIKEIDIILNNKDLLAEEYNKRNSKLPEHSKIFSINHFSQILLREREKEMEKINSYNKLLEPKNYATVKLKIEKDLDLLSNIKLDGTIKNNVLKYIISLQDIFLECLSRQIEKAETKKEILYLIYALRYYNFLPITKEKCIKDIKEIRMKRQSIENMLIEKMYGMKMINKNIGLNIIDKIFYQKIISLETIEFEFKTDIEKILLILYDEKTIAETIEIDENDIEVNKIRFNKRMKLFN